MKLENIAEALMAKRHALDVARAFGAAGWPKVEDVRHGVIGRSGQYSILLPEWVLDSWDKTQRPHFEIFDSRKEIASWTDFMVSPERAKERLERYGEKWDHMLEKIPEYEEHGA